MPVWWPDGKRIAFASVRAGEWGIYVKVADNSASEEQIIESDIPKMPMSWSPDSKYLVYWLNDPKTKGDVWAIPVTGDRKPVSILQTNADERTRRSRPMESGSRIP